MNAPAEPAVIVQISPNHTITYTMPQDVYQLVAAVLENWPYIYGRHPKATVDRAIGLLEWALPGIRDRITVVKTVTEQRVRGNSPDFLYIDNLFPDSAS